MEAIPSLKKHKKKVLFTLFTLTKIPFIIYLVFTLSTVPAIDAVSYKTVYGAHRGDSVDYFENTAEAIESAAKDQDYQFIEFDLQYTKDGKIVVFHDNGLLRTTGYSGNISDLTYEEIQNMTNFYVPLYEEVMDLIPEEKKLNIEIKSQGDLEEDKALLDYVVQDITNRGIRENIMISSVSAEVIIYSKQAYPDIKTGKIYWIHKSTYIPLDFLTEDLYEDIETFDADYLMLHGSNIHNMSSLVKHKPEDTTLVFWYFDNQMYLVEIDETDGMW